MKVTFEGIPSGDHECFCFAVTKEEYKRIVNKDPTRNDRSPFYDGLFMLYPDDILKTLGVGGVTEQSLKFTVSVEE